MARPTAEPDSATPGGVSANGSTKARPAADVVDEALAAHPGRTAADLAALTGLGGSTVTKALAALEKAGQAHRHTDANGTGRKPAATWQSTAPAPAPPAPAATTRRQHDDDGRRNRLGKGQLGALVLEYLRAHPGDDLGATAVGKALSRSQGAVANCLTKLATSGDVVLSSDKPRRYRLAS